MQPEADPLLRGIFAKTGTKESIELRLWKKIMGYEKKAGISVNRGYKE
jgi:hypothetical protein